MVYRLGGDDDEDARPSLLDSVKASDGQVRCLVCGGVKVCLAFFYARGNDRTSKQAQKIRSFPLSGHSACVSKHLFAVPVSYRAGKRRSHFTLLMIGSIYTLRLVHGRTALFVACEESALIHQATSRQPRHRLQTFE